MKRNLYLLSLALRGVARRAKADEKSGEEWFMGPVDDAVLQYAEYVAPYIATMCGVRMHVAHGNVGPRAAGRTPCLTPSGGSFMARCAR